MTPYTTPLIEPPLTQSPPSVRTPEGFVLSSVIPGGLALAVLGVQLGTGTYPVVRL